MPLFTKQEQELETHFDKWVYFLKHLEDFDNIPAILNEPIFQKGFEIAELSHLSSDQYDAYLKSVLSYNEAKAALNTAFDDGQVAMLARLIAKRFGPLSDTARKRLHDANSDQLEHWADALLDAPTLAAVFGDG